jgi:arsenical pump membrane protein
MHAALAQAWPPFVLVAGLLSIGLVAGRDGLFDAAASLLARLPGPPVALLLACFALVACVTALLNLDTSAVFLTPVLVKVARHRGVEIAPFLYGSVFMANASSLFLPGSNLTNLLVLSGGRVSGGTFLARMLPIALAAPLVTAAGLVAIHRSRLLRVHSESSSAGAGLGTDHASSSAEAGLGTDNATARAEMASHMGDRPASATVTPRPGLVLWGALLLAAGAIVALRNPALPVLALGLILFAWRVRGGGLSWREALSSLGAPVLVGLFAVSVLLGTLARASAFPADVLHSAGGLATATIAAGASVLVNNLPAAVLLSAKAPAHASALLLGLNVGPNLAVTGSLSALLWWRAARAVGARPSARAYSRQGLLLAPVAILGALAAGGQL